MNHTGKIAAGVVAGLAIGAILGVLFAPAKGADTRKKIREQGKDLADTLADKAGLKKMCSNCGEPETTT
jgi:gas vesicle protein